MSRHQLALQDDRLADPCLGHFEPVGQHLFGDLWGTFVVVLERTLGAAGLHHHDGDIGVVGIAERPARHHQLEGRGVALFEGGVRDPNPVGRIRHPDSTDWSVEGDA